MRHSLPLLYFFLFSCSTLFAQQERFQIPDSLVSKTNNELKSLAKKKRYKHPGTAKLYIEVLHKKAAQQQNQIDLIESFFYFGHIAFIQGEYTNSISYINKGIALAETDKDSILRKLYAVRGNTQEAYGQYEKAYEDFETCLEISEKYNDRKGIFIAKTSFAKLKLNNRQYTEALKIYKEYYKVSKDTTLVSKNSRLSLLIGISDTYLKMEALDSARVYMEIGLKESIAFDDFDSACYFYTYNGIYEYYKGNIKKALKHFEEARKKISERQIRHKLNIEVFYYMAQCHFALKDYQTSIDIINNAFDIIREENSKKQSVSTKLKAEANFVPYEYLYFLKLLSRSYEGIGDEKNQDKYWNQYTEQNSENEKGVFKIDKLIYNLLDKKEEKAFIKRQDERKVAAEKQVEYLYYILGFVCIVFLGTYLFFRKKEQKKAVAYKALIEKVSALEAKSNTESLENIVATKKTVNITDKKAQSILQGLEKFETQELYLDSACNLRFVAKKVKTNATYLSKIINEQKEISFNDYINNLRIQYTLKRLKSDTLFRAYSIKSISEEVGYKSADSFTKHFKKQTSLYPSYYIKKLNQEIS